jgi:predicted small secreted protein
MTASLQFNTAFASSGTSAAKTIYAYPVNSAGQGPTGGMAAIGTWTIPTPPFVVSLTPATGQGSSQTFTLTVSDLAGASDLASVQILFANSTSLSSACAVTYIAQQKNIGLSNDAGTGYAGYVTSGQAGSVSNSQCTLSGAGSSIQTAGKSLILTVSLQFNVAFASLGTSAAKTIYANPLNSAAQGPSGGMVSSGTWTIPKAGLPTIVSLSPSSGHGTSQAFALTVSDPAGASDLASVELLFANSTTLSKACAVTYSSQQKTVGLTNDAGTGSAGSITPGQSGSVSNSQCMLSGIGSSIQSSGSSLIMTVNLQFKTAFASIGSGATKSIYANAVNSAAQGPTGGMAAKGTWTIPTPPTVVSLSPASGQGSSQAFALTSADSAGGSDLSSVEIIFSSSGSSNAACVVNYISNQKQFGLLNDAASNYVAYLTPGTNASISNSQCTLNGSGSSIKITGNNLTMTVSLQFKPAFETTGSATKKVYGYPVSSAGLTPTNWVAMGSWTVQ